MTWQRIGTPTHSTIPPLRTWSPGDTRSVKKPDLRILDTICITAAKYNKHYCFPSLQRLRSLGALYHGVTQSTRTIVRHINALILAGYITRQRRHRRLPNGSLELHSTLYHVRARAMHRLARLRAAIYHAFSAVVDNYPLHAVTPPAKQRRPFISSAVTVAVRAPP